MIDNTDRIVGGNQFFTSEEKSILSVYRDTTYRFRRYRVDSDDAPVSTKSRRFSWFEPCSLMLNEERIKSWIKMNPPISFTFNYLFVHRRFFTKTTNKFNYIKSMRFTFL